MCAVFFCGKHESICWTDGRLLYKREERPNMLRKGSNMSVGLNLKEGATRDFLAVGVLVAVKRPVRISVVVVTDTVPVPDGSAGVVVDAEPGELHSEDASYSTPLIMTPSPLMIMFLSFSEHVSGILRSQQVGEGEEGRLLVCVAFSGPVVLNTERSTGRPVEIEVPIIIRAKTWKAVSG